MDLGAVMDELGVALTGVPGLRVSPYWAERPTPPFAVVGFPEELHYDLTMGDGGEQFSVPIIVGVSRGDGRTARNRIIGYTKGTGFGTVKNAVETHHGIAWDSARVQSVEFGMGTWSGVEYLTATFTVDIIGTGV
jgi:hypothetical protein